MLLVTLANAPANMKTINMRIKFGWLAPFKNASIAEFIFPLYSKIANIIAGNAAIGALT